MGTKTRGGKSTSPTPEVPATKISADSTQEQESLTADSIQEQESHTAESIQEKEPHTLKMDSDLLYVLDHIMILRQDHNVRQCLEYDGITTIQELLYLSEDNVANSTPNFCVALHLIQRSHAYG